MTGHQHRAQSRKPAADHRLDQFAAAVAEARTTNPALAALATTESQFIDAAMDIGAHLDRPTVGAAWLILGQLFSTNLASVPPEQQAAQLAVLLNVAKLAGARLYVGDRLPVTLPCPFAYGDGTPCKTSRTGATPEQAETLMRAHVWQNHPGETWPPKPGPQARTVLPVPLPNADGVPQTVTRASGIVPGGELLEPDADGEEAVRAYEMARGAATVAEMLISDGYIALDRLPAVTTPNQDRDFPLPPENPTFDEAKRYANIRVIAEWLLRIDARPDPFTGKSGTLTDREAWARALKQYDELVLDDLRRKPPSRHKPHEVCDCRPGETYHCAADDTDGEAQG